MQQRKSRKQRKDDWLSVEIDLRNQGYRRIGGIDEAGCGPLAGPVVAACVIIPEDFDLLELDDSKKLSQSARLRLNEQITACAEYGIGLVESEDIDRLNIRQATFLAMQRAVNNLSSPPDYLVVDCWRVPFWNDAQRGYVGGDGLIRSIAAASVLAKTYRDRLMEEAAAVYPQYEFERHKGYPTKRHYELLKKYGPCPLHRRSFLKKLQQLELAEILS